MRAGRLDEWVIFETPTKTTQLSGFKSSAWVTLLSDWCEVTRLAGIEKYETSQLTEVADVKLNMRYRTNITKTMRFILNGEYYSIYSVKEMKRMRGIEIFGKLIEIT